MFDRLQPRIGFRYATWLIALIMLLTLSIPVACLRMRWRPHKVRRIFDAKAWREPAFSLWAAYLFVSLCGLYLPSFYIQLYGSRFMETGLSFYLLPVLNAGSLFGRIVCSKDPLQFTTLRGIQIPLHIADKVGPLNIEIPFTIFASVLGFAWTAIENTTGIFVFCIVYGFLAGAITTVTAVIDAALCPSLDVVGVRMGMLLVPWAFGLLIGEPIAGAILPSSSGWKGLQVFTGSVLAVAAFLCIAVRWTHYGMRWDKKC